MVLSPLRAILTRWRRARAGRSDALGEQRAALEALHIRQLDMLQRVRIEAVEAMEARRQLEARIHALDDEADDAAREARTGANVESDDFVRDQLRREQVARQRATALLPVADRLRAQEQVLSAAVARLAGKVEAFADRKEALLAQQSAAQATDHVAVEAREFRALSKSIDVALAEAHDAVAVAGSDAAADGRAAAVDGPAAADPPAADDRRVEPPG